MRLLPLDYAVMIAVVVIYVCLLLFTMRSDSGEPLVYITTQTDEYVYTLGDSATLLLTGPVGETQVIIQDGAVRVMRSPGREQICVRKGTISRDGEWLICLPNRIFIRIAAGDAIDSYSY